jgi:mycofactocin system glycosyltransferase
VPATAIDVTVVVPVRDRVAQLDRCLASLRGTRCVVVDDGSRDPDAIAAVAHSHGARLIRRPSAGGPAAARNAALPDIRSELVAFIDSDCVASPDWVDHLAGHFADPLVGAVAPRVVPAGHDGSGGYRGCVGLHDLGRREARVQPLGRVAFVPTAALVVRRAAIEAVGAFESMLRFGEDVDLIWRLDEAGWRVRYDPSVEVVHDEPASWCGRLARRFDYGTAAAPLAFRHSGASAHLVVARWPLAAVGGVLAGQPAVAMAAAIGTVAKTRRALRRADVDELSVGRQGAAALVGTWRGVGRYATQLGLPLLAVAAWRTRRPMRIAALAALVTAAPVTDWIETRPGVSLSRYVAGRIADDAAYGAGVYAGCIKERTMAPLRVATSQRRGERNAR